MAVVTPAEASALETLREQERHLVEFVGKTHNAVLKKRAEATLHTTRQAIEHLSSGKEH